MNKTTDNQKENETFYVQNITPSYHFVSDLKLTFSPYQVIDLTHEHRELNKRSNDLKTSLQLGYLVHISEEEAERLRYINTLMLKEEQEKGAYKSEDPRRRNNNDVIDRRRKSDEYNIDNSNNAIHYATVFNHLRNEMASHNQQLSAMEFGKMVENNPNYIKNYMRNMKEPSITDTKATYAVLGGDGTRMARQAQMGNFNTDPDSFGRDMGMPVYRPNIPDAVDLDNDYDDDDDYAEEIDITKEANEERGTFRRNQ